MKKVTFLAILPVLVCAFVFSQAPLNMVTWNIESGGNSPAVIARQLEDFRGYDIISLQEVNDANRERYTRVFGDGYGWVLSESGSRFNDHLLVLYNRSRLEALSIRELHEYNGVVINSNIRRTGKRSPLIIRFRDRVSGLDFYHVTVHLARSNDAQRSLEALVLRDWILDRSDPVLALGDFNFDFSFADEAGGNDAYRLFTRDPRIDWIEPEVFLDTNYSESGGRETYPDSILDFAFAANTARRWDIRSKVYVRPGDFPDTDETSDHRAVTATVFF